MIDKESLHIGISKVRSKVLNFEKISDSDDCIDCIGSTYSKVIYDIWMDLFVLIKDICDNSVELSRSCYSPDIAFIDDYLCQVEEIIDNELVINTMPELFKVCLEQYLPNYISLLNGVECLDSIHSKILLLKGKVIPSPSFLVN